MPRYREISATEARLLMQQRPETLMVDMRDAYAFKQHHYTDAIHLDETTLKRLLKNTPRATPVVVVCYHGNSSKDIAQLFQDFGFTDSFSLSGGYDAWLKLPSTAPAETCSDLNLAGSSR